MILPTSYITNWHLIQLHHQQQMDKNTVLENETRILHCYNIGDQVLLLPDVSPEN
jgi:HD-like signal output (HDOD) protein